MRDYGSPLYKWVRQWGFAYNYSYNIQKRTHKDLMRYYSHVRDGADLSDAYSEATTAYRPVGEWVSSCIERVGEVEVLDLDRYIEVENVGYGHIDLLCRLPEGDIAVIDLRAPSLHKRHLLQPMWNAHLLTLTDPQLVVEKIAVVTPADDVIQAFGHSRGEQLAYELARREMSSYMEYEAHIEDAETAIRVDGHILNELCGYDPEHFAE